MAVAQVRTGACRAGQVVLANLWRYDGFPASLWCLSFAFRPQRQPLLLQQQQKHHNLAIWPNYGVFCLRRRPDVILFVLLPVRILDGDGSPLPEG
jgi:hypothetical protein